jgi:phosphatidylserine/phosphatidylglycerophosphate/cardiolipin synthase-like enzyme/uncharacterized membrane protein YdjX (TVP38/TMEM64 family)
VNQNSLFSHLYKPGQNCWQTGVADKAALLIDSANYYRAIYESICAAEHSIFILGWDINGNIDLVRGNEAQDNECPAKLYDLINWKARQNPDIQIYLNQWNYSLFFMKEREPFSDYRWHFKSTDNVHYCEDNHIPFLSSHHQKIITIDDKIAYCGGMDIGVERWDERHHHVETPERCDVVEPLLPADKEFESHQPRHDIQMILTGEDMKIFACLVRERWRKGAGFDAIPVRVKSEQESAFMPPSVKKDFARVPFAVSRTLPQLGRRAAVKEIEQAYIDEIAQAEQFIYIENQYVTSATIARALNRQLKEKPNLRVLMISCDHPKGWMERKTMWHGRYQFAQLVRKNIDNPDRFVVTYPVCRENGKERSIYIHSKLMIVDDRILHIGSANLNNRSMGMDTECDVSIAGDDALLRAGIFNYACDLIREHTGKTMEDIRYCIQENRPLPELLSETPQSRQHLVPVTDAEYKNEKFTSIVRFFGDRPKPVLPISFLSRQATIFWLLFITLATVLWWQFGDNLTGLYSQEEMVGFLEKFKTSPYAPLIIVGIYIAAGIAFISVMALNLAVAIIFGPVYGFLYSYLGALSSATFIYVIGRLIHKKEYRLLEKSTRKIQHYTKKGGVTGMTLIRMLPIAPFTLVNIAFGMIGIGYVSYILSTILGLAPGIVAKAIFGGALSEALKNPDPKTYAMVGGAIFIWIAIIFLTHLVVRYFQKKFDS